MKLKTQFLTFALLVLMALLGCNKDDNTISTPDPTIQEPETPVIPDDSIEDDSIEIDVDLTLETMARSLNLQSEALSKYNEYLEETAEVERAIFYTGLWLQQNKNVQEVAFTSSYIVHVTFKNGLQSNLVFLPEDENGKAIYRGAPSTSGNGVEKPASKMPVKAFGGKNSASKSAEKEIKNKKVLVFNVEEFEFYRNDYSAPLAVLNNNTITDLEVTVLSNEHASLQKIDEFYKYGLIIINTHGLPGSFSIKMGEERWGPAEPITEEYIDEYILEITGKNPEDFKNGLLTINLKTKTNILKSIESFEIKIGVTDKYIRNLRPLDDAVVFANFCYSGHEVEGPNTRNLVEAFKAIGAKTYYGWATDYGEGEEVIDSGAKSAELILLKNLVSDGDLTGDSHKKENGEAIVMSWENPNDLSPGVSVYTILPNQDGTIDFEDSYQKLWVNNQRPDPRVNALALQHHIDPEYYYDNDTDEIVFYVPVSIWEVPHPEYNDPNGRILYVGFRFDPVTPPANKEVVRYDVETIEHSVDGRDYTSWCGFRTFYAEHDDPILNPSGLNLDYEGKYWLSCGGGYKDETDFARIKGLSITGLAKVTVTLKSKN